ncbi:MAG: response regulator [Lachnospiraceae bacterium]|nr:response regulator [Lachnospiraceae bacterium]
MKKLNYGILVVLVTVIVAILVMNATMYYQLTKEQTESLGREQLEMISSELQTTLKDAEILLWRVASGAESLKKENANNRELAAYLKNWKDHPGNDSCINVYAAGTNWDIIPDFVKPEGFVASDRVWFKGAKEAGVGEVYITAPYIDAATNDMCFSISLLLEDEDTIVGLDFNLTAVQKTLEDISKLSGGDALIISSSGIIVGYKDDEVIGKSLADKLPQYNSIFKEILSANEDSMTFETKIAGKKCNVFCSSANGEWYLISSVSNNILYKDSYIQLFRNSLISFIVVIIIIILYVISKRNQIKAEEALKVKEEFLSRMSSELKIPMNFILTHSDYDALDNSDDPKEYMNRLRETAYNLDSKISNLLSYTVIVNAEEKEEKEKADKKPKKTEFRSRHNSVIIGGVLAILCVTMLISITISTNVISKWGNTRMKKEVENYVNEVDTWIVEQKSILDMFVSSISANPDILTDYEGAVKWLDDITKQYEDISVTYMTNPEFEHTVIMNNGWEPDDDWKVEERQWYIDTINSTEKDGFSISAPYFDEQTGYYCVTLSERVYDAHGNFMGNFGIDFYLDKLTKILNESYTDQGYAFLVDMNGQIINHPYDKFELSVESGASVKDAGYQKVVDSDKTVVIKDYDGKRKAAYANKENNSNFSVICIKNWDVIYGSIILYNLLFIALFGVCITAILYLIRTLMNWQNKANDTLKEAALEAERAGRAKSQFLAQMSHEIRTPINAVLGMNEMIMRENEQETINVYAENIQNAGRTLLALINSILDFSKIEDGKMEIVPVNYDTASLINDLVNMIQARADKKGLKFKTEISKDLPKTMYGDDVRIRQVITNILTNAVKYTEKGSVTLKIDIASKTEDTVVLNVEVKDTGIGIREEDLDKLFISFQRLDMEKNRSIEGTGLGISIVNKLLKMMDSELKVDSVYGEGSNFHFEIAQKVIDAEEIGKYEDRLKDSKVSAKSTRYVYAPNAKVLFIDDNNMNLMVAKGLLRRSKIKVDTALSGREGIELIEENHYNIVFLDHMMPKMDGIETLEELKERNMIPSDTVVVMMTANAVVGAKEEYLKAGFEDYLSKPVDVKKLEEMLAKYIPDDLVEYKET